MAWLFAPAAAASNLASTLPSPVIELSVSLSGTPMPRPFSWRGWRTRPWVKLLSGTICEPSTASLGVASFISSLRAIPVSHFPSLESSLEPLTHATSGLMLHVSSARSGRCSSFWRTSLNICDWGSERSHKTYREWAIGLRREYSARLKLARRTSGNASLPWPTPDVSSQQRSHPEPHRKATDQSRNLATEAAFWPSPLSHDGRRPGSDATSTQGANLKRDAEAWATPAARDWKSDNAGQSPEHSPLLGRQVLRTPKGGSASSESAPTSHQQWPPPRPRPAKLDKLESHHRNATGLGMKLNPRFVEWLMGWPAGWSIAKTNSGCSETAWCQWLLQWRSLLFGESWRN